MTTSAFHCWTSLTSATLVPVSFYNVLATSTPGDFGANTPYLRVNVSGTTTVYLSVQADFMGTSVTGAGNIFARRVR